MSAVEKLFAEHRLIERVIMALSNCVHSIGEDNDGVRCDLLRFVTFFRDFADLIHHEKEEEFLMPALVASGVRWDEGIILRLRKEHDFERHLMQSLRHLTLQSAPWSKDDRRRIVELSERFIGFMRNHIDYEDRELHGLVRGRMTPEAGADLEAQLGKFDGKRADAGELELLTTLGRELAERYAIAP
jgi:hemerythrin-like domain-containing protein